MNHPPLSIVLLSILCLYHLQICVNANDTPTIFKDTNIETFKWFAGGDTFGNPEVYSCHPEVELSISTIKTIPGGSVTMRLSKKEYGFFLRPFKKDFFMKRILQLALYKRIGDEEDQQRTSLDFIGFLNPLFRKPDGAMTHIEFTMPLFLDDDYYLIKVSYWNEENSPPRFTTVGYASNIFVTRTSLTPLFTTTVNNHILDQWGTYNDRFIVYGQKPNKMTNGQEVTSFLSHKKTLEEICIICKKNPNRPACTVNVPSSTAIKDKNVSGDWRHVHNKISVNHICDIVSLLHQLRKFKLRWFGIGTILPQMDLWKFIKAYLWDIGDMSILIRTLFPTKKHLLKAVYKEFVQTFLHISKKSYLHFLPIRHVVIPDISKYGLAYFPNGELSVLSFNLMLEVLNNYFIPSEVRPNHENCNELKPNQETYGKFGVPPPSYEESQQGISYYENRSFNDDLSQYGEDEDTNEQEYTENLLEKHPDHRSGILNDKNNGVNAIHPQTSEQGSHNQYSEPGLQTKPIYYSERRYFSGGSSKRYGSNISPVGIPPTWNDS